MFQVSNNWVLGCWVIVILRQVLGKCMIVGNLDPQEHYCVVLGLRSIRHGGKGTNKWNIPSHSGFKVRGT